jgi:hypothetical protein
LKIAANGDLINTSRFAYNDYFTNLIKTVTNVSLASGDIDLIVDSVVSGVSAAITGQPIVLTSGDINTIASAASASIAVYGDMRWSKIVGIPMTEWDVMVKRNPA